MNWGYEMKIQFDIVGKHLINNVNLNILSVYATWSAAVCDHQKNSNDCSGNAKIENKNAEHPSALFNHGWFNKTIIFNICAIM